VTSATAANKSTHFYNPILRPTSSEERARRHATLREAMNREGFEALVITGRDDIRYRGRVSYVSDVWQLIADAFVVLPLKGDAVFVGTPVMGLGQAMLTDWISEFRMSGYPGKEVGQILRELGLAKSEIGLVGLADSLSARHLHEMEEAIPEAHLRDATELFDGIRQVKSEEELSNLRETSELFRQVFTEIKSVLTPGMREIDLAAEAHRLMRKQGCRSVMVLVASTPFSAISFGTTKEIERDDLVMVWLEGPGPSGYWLELRQCYSFGPPSDDVWRFWELQVEAVTAGVEAMKSGVPAHEFVATYGRAMKRDGWSVETNPTEQSHMYSMHGIGTDAIEGVWVPGKDRILRENEVVAIHPLVDFDNEEDAARLGGYGIGIADSVLVTKEGGVRLTYEIDTFNIL
jgi:Xaa-Pro aminopeptidase